jgi:hypothetical protein
VVEKFIPIRRATSDTFNSPSLSISFRIFIRGLEEKTFSSSIKLHRARVLTLAYEYFPTNILDCFAALELDQESLKKKNSKQQLWVT